jgi:Ice-binding-like
MRLLKWLCLGALASSLNAFAGLTSNIYLGAANSFAVLGASTVTNTGDSVVFGNLGLYPGTSITGFPPGIVNGTTDNDNAVAMQAQADALTAYNNAAGQSATGTLTGEDLGGMTLTPGVYFFSSSAQLTGTLTLNDEGNPDAVFIFQIGSTLTTASNSAVVFSDSSGQGGSVTWEVGSSATLGTGTTFEGTILANTSITLDTNASIGCGRAIALNGAVTMDTNDISVADTGGCQAVYDGSAPEPSTGSLVLLIGAPALLWLRKSRPQRQ